ncbi:MAG: class I tRNA ligase family protein [bacterium]|nr:class I tRNA ligase family protein [bacterium]
MLRGLKQFNLPDLEEKVLKFWQENNVFKKSITNREKSGAKPFRFFEGPPTANGQPGMHHVLGRAFKDIMLRYKTMRGYYVWRRAGWDTHGLPVEIQVEKELGIKNKSEIEKFGIAGFNTRAKASVWKYKIEWEKLTNRIGFWLDFENPYITYDNNYIESLWWTLSQINKRGLLKKIYKVVPWCPRCQTPLSSHELGQPGAYQKTKDPSAYVKFALKPPSAKTSKDKPAKTKEFLLVWTTTPWTLPANTAIAVNPKLTYTKYKIGNEYLWSYNPPPANDKTSEIQVVEKISGNKLVGIEYKPLYPNTGTHKVIGADFVSTEDGTGLVHIAPAFGEEDLKAMSRENFPLADIPITIDDLGIVNKGLPGAGKFIKDADKDISADLAERGLLYHQDKIEHEYPFCWRCSAPLIYFARDSWFISMSKLRTSLLAANKTINWVPAHIKEGRFGEWLREVKDWAISRNRYWGTPLPIWECNNDHKLIISDLDDLNKHRYSLNKILYVRHGESDHNLSKILASGAERGNKKSKLTKLGTEQVSKLAKKLKKENIDAIYASPYFRTRQTAETIGKELGLKVVYDERLGEIQLGVFNGMHEREYRNFFANPLERFIKTPPGGENLADVRKRMLSAVADIRAKHSDSNIIIVGHGDPLWLMASGIRGLSNEETLEADYPKVGSSSKLASNNWPMDQNGQLDLHRPYIDSIFLKCPNCKEKMTRIKEVADVWFDSGAMPYAQWHYPFENKELVDKKLQYPADYIVEGVDQTRGWFYTLLAVSTLLKRGAPYKNVVSLGLLLDKNGQKMSKSKGNVVDPWEMIQKYGADTIRWFFYTINAPGETKKFDENELSKVLRNFFLMIYNSYNFLQTYDASSVGKPIKILDTWILARLHQTTADVTSNLEKYEIGQAAKVIEKFVNDLSRWYIRRSRKNVSPKILKQSLETLAKLMAPFSPFFAETLYQALNDGKQFKSVHLVDWPETNKKALDENLLSAMDELRKLAALALAAREKAGIKVRQPLNVLKIYSTKSEIKNYKELLIILADEINVKKVVFDEEVDDVELDIEITPELKAEGTMRELMRSVQKLRHDAKLQPKDMINLYMELPDQLKTVATANLAKLKKDIKAKSIDFKKGKIDAETSTKLDNQPIWVGLKKI